jgi:NAD(P)H-nitrite reductase large subunit
MRGDSEIWRIKSDGIVAETYQQENRLRLYVGLNFLSGAIVMGDQTLSRPLQVLIREQVDISTIRDRLLSPDASLADTINIFWERYTQNHANQVA